MKGHEKVSAGERFNMILQSLEKEEENRKDLILPLSDLRMREDGKIITDFGEYEIGKEGLGQLAKPYRMSNQHLQLLINEGRTDLVAKQFNHFLNKSDRNEEIQLRVVENRIKGIVSKKYKSFNDFDLFNIVSDVMNDTSDIKLQNFYRDDKRTHARFIFDEYEENIGMSEEGGLDRDIIKCGFDIKNSEIGMSKLRIDAISFRLICSNGLMAWVKDEEKSINVKHMGFDFNLLKSDIKEKVYRSFNESKQSVIQLKKSRNIKVEDPLKEIERIAKNERLGKKQIERLKEVYYIEPQNNLFGVISAFTRYARELEEKNGDNELRTRIEERAGLLLERVS